MFDELFNRVNELTSVITTNNSATILIPESADATTQTIDQTIKHSDTASKNNHDCTGQASDTVTATATRVDSDRDRNNSAKTQVWFARKFLPNRLTGNICRHQMQWLREPVDPRKDNPTYGTRGVSSYFKLITPYASILRPRNEEQDSAPLKRPKRGRRGVNSQRRHEQRRKQKQWASDSIKYQR